MEIFELRDPKWLWLLSLLPVLLVFLIYSWRHFFAFRDYWRQNPYLFEGRLPPWSLRVAKAVFCLAGLALIALALADPYYRYPAAEKFFKGVRFVFVADVSLSMAQAEDLLPNRLAAAKKEIRDAIADLDGNYELALIPFAGDANQNYYLPSFDKLSFFLALDNLTDETVPIPGTDLASALEAPRRLISELKLDKDGVNVVILLSDGGREEGFAANRMELSQLAGQLKKNAELYVIGIGRPTPAPLIERDWDGNFSGFTKQPPGQRTAYSELDEDLLKFIAASGGGRYSRFDRRGQLGAEIKKLTERYRRFAKTEQTWQWRPLRPWLLLAAVFALFLTLAELPRKPPG